MCNNSLDRTRYAGWYRDFHPTRFVPCPAHTLKLGGAAFFAASVSNAM